GTVTFNDGSTTLGTATLAAGVARFSTSSLGQATHSITAVYAGDTNHNTSTSAALSQVVDKLATATSLASSVNPSAFGQSVTFTGTVSGGTNPGGSVTFKDGAATLGTGTVSAGVATFNTSALAAGSHSITASYGGDASNAGSTSAAV